MNILHVKGDVDACASDECDIGEDGGADVIGQKLDEQRIGGARLGDESEACRSDEECADDEKCVGEALIHGSNEQLAISN